MCGVKRIPSATQAEKRCFPLRVCVPQADITRQMEKRRKEIGQKSNCAKLECSDVEFCVEAESPEGGEALYNPGRSRALGEYAEAEGVVQMKAGRWLTWLGSVLLFLTGIGHGMKLGNVQGMMAAGGVKMPLAGMMRTCWMVFSGEMVALAVIAALASVMAGGRRFVLICGLTMAFDAALSLYFLGPFIGVYLSAAVAVLFLAGGFLQAKQAA